MNRILRTLVIGGALAAVSIPAVGFAVDSASDAPSMHQRDAGQRMNRKLEKMTVQLDLTAAQQAQIKAIYNEAHAGTVDAKQQIRSTMKALDAAITNGADNDTIAELAIDAHTVRGDMREARKDAHKQVRAVLTPEQQEKAKALRADRKGQRGEQGRRGRKGGHRGQGGFGGPL